MKALFITAVCLFGLGGAGAQPRMPLAAAGSEPVAFEQRGDAIEQALAGLTGRVSEGRQLVVGRLTQCTLCHEVPGLRGRQGTIGPSLEQVGARLSPGQIRLRVVNPWAVNPQAAMPAYYSLQHQHQVEPDGRGRTVLSAQQIEDIVAYLAQLR